MNISWDEYFHQRFRQEMWIFYYRPIFECGPFFLTQTLIIKLWKWESAFGRLGPKWPHSVGIGLRKWAIKWPPSVGIGLRNWAICYLERIWDGEKIPHKWLSKNSERVFPHERRSCDWGNSVSLWLLSHECGSFSNPNSLQMRKKIIMLKGKL